MVAKQVVNTLLSDRGMFSAAIDSPQLDVGSSVSTLFVENHHAKNAPPI